MSQQEEDQRLEDQAAAETEMIDAARTLYIDYRYSEKEILDILKGSVFS